MSAELLGSLCPTTRTGVVEGLFKAMKRKKRLRHTQCVGSVIQSAIANCFSDAKAGWLSGKAASWAFSSTSVHKNMSVRAILMGSESQ